MCLTVQVPGCVTPDSETFGLSNRGKPCGKHLRTLPYPDLWEPLRTPGTVLYQRGSRSLLIYHTPTDRVCQGKVVKSFYRYPRGIPVYHTPLARGCQGGEKNHKPELSSPRLGPRLAPCKVHASRSWHATCICRGSGTILACGTDLAYRAGETRVGHRGQCAATGDKD